jgi:RNA polymerase sigma-70 factor, ECF subfamily
VQDPDPRVLARARDGDLAAFEDIVRHYQADLFRLACHLVRDRTTAEDVTQEAFIRAFRFLRSYRGDSPFSSWLMRILRNCAMDALRRQHSQVVRHRDEDLRASSVADPVVRAELDAALRAITPDHREPFLLIEVFGLSYADASDVLGIRIGTVKSRMHRARLALCRALADDEAAEGLR